MMIDLNSNQGLSLISLLAAVALTGVLAVSVVKLASNQAKLSKMAEIIDQREMIIRFYTSLMHDNRVWKCSLYDSVNSALLAHVVDHTSSGFSGAVVLKTSDCKFEERKIGSDYFEELRPLTANYGVGSHYRSSGSFFGAGQNPLLLGNSATSHQPGRWWWRAGLTGEDKGEGTVELVLTVELDAGSYSLAHAGFMPQDLSGNTEYRVHWSENAIKGGSKDCGSDDQVIVAVGDHSGDKEIFCGGEYYAPGATGFKDDAKLYTVVSHFDGSGAITYSDDYERMAMEIRPDGLEENYRPKEDVREGEMHQTQINGKDGWLMPSVRAYRDHGISRHEKTHTMFKTQYRSQYSYFRGPRGVRGARRTSCYENWSCKCEDRRPLTITCSNQSCPYNAPGGCGPWGSQSIDCTCTRSRPCNLGETGPCTEDYPCTKTGPTECCHGWSWDAQAPGNGGTEGAYPQ